MKNSKIKRRKKETGKGHVKKGQEIINEKMKEKGRKQKKERNKRAMKKQSIQR